MAPKHIIVGLRVEKKLTQYATLIRETRKQKTKWLNFWTTLYTIL